MNLSNTSNTGRPVVVPNSRVEITAIGMHTANVAGTRATFHLSCTAATITSTTEIREVMPANTSEPKNSTPIIEPKGACT